MVYESSYQKDAETLELQGKASTHVQSFDLPPFPIFSLKSSSDPHACATSDQPSCPSLETAFQRRASFCCLKLYKSQLFGPGNVVAKPELV
jgi:hypothetical protein